MALKPRDERLVGLHELAASFTDAVQCAASLSRDLDEAVAALRAFAERRREDAEPYAGEERRRAE